MVRKTILVSSSKGGCGKTFISANLALSLAKRDLRVGVLDSDIDSSNLPKMMNVEGIIGVSEEERKFIPVKKDNIQVFAMRVLTDGPVSKTGEEYAQIIQDVVGNSEWDCDYMVVDLPAGSSSILKEVIACLAESIVGCVVVGLPQESQDAHDACEVMRSFEIPILALFENMSGAVFGKECLSGVAEEFGVPFYTIPLRKEIRTNNEKGRPGLKGEMAKPIEAVVDVVIKTKPEKVGIVDKFMKKVREFEESVVVDIVAFTIKNANTQMDLGSLKGKYSMRDFVVRFTITNDTGEKVYMSNKFRITDSGVLVIPAQGESERFHIEIPFSCLARCCMGQQKVNGEIVPFDMIQAWRMGMIRTSGFGSTQALFRFGKFFSEAIPTVREKFGDVLEKVI